MKGKTQELSKLFIRALVVAASSLAMIACSPPKSVQGPLDTAGAENDLGLTTNLDPKTNRTESAEPQTAVESLIRGLRPGEFFSNLLEAGDSDFFRIDIIPGRQRVEIDLQASFFGDFRLRLRRGRTRGPVVASTFSSRLSLEIGEPGKYYIEVEEVGFFSDDNDRFRYTVHWQDFDSQSDVRFHPLVFEPIHYLQQNPDLVAAGAAVDFNDQIGARRHWAASGFLEGRVGSSTFHAASYLARYPDLQRAFGANYQAAALHFINAGRFEGRHGAADGAGAPAPGAPAPAPANVLLSAAIFDAQFYLDSHPDLRAAGINSAEGAQTHWLNHGLREGRLGTPGFHAPTYLARYVDLQAAFGNDLARAAEHFITNGQAEGRLGH